MKNSEKTLTSDVAAITLVQPLEIIAQPESIQAQEGEEKDIKLTAVGATSYQWQRSADGQTWTGIGATNQNYTGSTTDTLTVKVSKNTAGFMYRCKVKNSEKTLTSDVATITLTQSLAITSQPESIQAKDGEEKDIKLTAVGATSYQWQRSADGQSWKGIGATNQNYTGSTTDTLTVKISKNTAGFSYRCVVKNAAGDRVTSESVSIEILEPVTITFDANGGSIYGNSTYTKSVDVNSYFFNDTMDAPTRSGYTFEGWYLDADCKTPMGFSYYVTEDLTLYAGWVKNTGCTITFDANGGSIYGNSTYTKSVDVNSYFFNDTMDAPTRSGYTFEEWYLDADCKTPMGFSYYVTEDLTLYAGWNEFDGCIVTFDANGGTVNGETTYSMTFARGENIDVSYSASRTGYVFCGWYLDPDCTDRVYMWDYVVNEDVTFYAGWAEAVYVTWNGNGGVLYNGESTCEDIVKCLYLVAKKKKEIELLRSQMSPEQLQSVDLSKEIAEKAALLNKLNSEIKAANIRLSGIKKDIIETDETVLLQSFGIYTPHYTYQLSDEYVITTKPIKNSNILQKRNLLVGKCGREWWTLIGFC